MVRMRESGRKSAEFDDTANIPDDSHIRESFVDSLQPVTPRYQLVELQMPLVAHDSRR